ncbi:hypothetical protein V5O48_006941 [Marasmius crinis-equi]|uniref:Uncharacterized protein n=1 Tax=Marasmius crinis-equi TaxID=585013 RepID=A0ABR3FI35_9AGAR
MLFVLLLIFLSISLVEAAARNVTLGFSDSSLQFAPGWIASNDQLSGALFYSFDEIAPALTATLPENTTRISYIGLKRAGGSQYGICFNCEDDSSSIILVDGHDDSIQDDGQAIPAVIFSLTVNRDRGARNTFSLFNLPDNRFTGPSTITFQLLVVTLDDGSDAPQNSGKIDPLNVIYSNKYYDAIINDLDTAINSFTKHHRKHFV